MVQAIFLLIASIGIMLIGVKTLGENLQRLMNDKVRKNINKFANNRVKMAGSGTAITFAMQSSTASTMMTVSLSAVGIFSLFQGLCFIIGCNVGSALTDVFLIFNSLSIKEFFACLSFVGIVLTFFKNEKVSIIGKSIMGFGLIFAGLCFISSSIATINKSFDIGSLFTSINYPILLLLVGIVATILLQSSFGTLALLISLVSSGAFNQFASTSSAPLLYSLSFILYGINIGTTFTTLLVSLSSNTTGKRIALFHLFFNLCGAVLFCGLNLTGFLNVITLITSNVSIQLIILDLIFNLTTGILMLALAKPVSHLFKHILKNKRNSDLDAWYIDENTLTNPIIAIKKLENNAYYLMLLVNGCFEKIEQYVFSETISNKKLATEIAKLNTICDIIVTNSENISGEIDSRGRVKLIFIQQYCKTIKKTLKNFSTMINIGIIDKEKIKLYEKQKIVVKRMFENIQLLINSLVDILKAIAFDDVNFDYQQSAIITMECLTNNSTIKNAQKFDYVSNYQNKTEKKHFVFFNLLNLLQDTANYLSDLSVESIEFASNENKGEKDDKNNNWFKC